MTQKERKITLTLNHSVLEQSKREVTMPLSELEGKPVVIGQEMKNHPWDGSGHLLLHFLMPRQVHALVFLENGKPFIRREQDEKDPIFLQSRIFGARHARVEKELADAPFELKDGDVLKLANFFMLKVKLH